MTASLVVQTSFLGDMVLTTPLFAHLSARGPLDVVCTPAAAALIGNDPCVREVIVYDKRGVDRGTGGVLRLARRLRARGYASAYLAQGSVRSGALAFAARIPDRVGFATSAGRAFYTTRIAPIDNMHHTARLLSLATRDPSRDPPRSSLRPRLYPGAAELNAVDALLGAHDALDRPLVALAPGSIWPTKRWPYYPALASALSDLGRMAIIGGPDDRPLAAEITTATGGNAIDATGRLSLLASAELIRRSAIVVTNDSAPLHLASAMDTPTIAVFGPTVPQFGFGPLADQSAVAGLDSLTCRPCDRHGPKRCPLGHWRCMRELTVESIAALARTLLSSAR